MIINENAGRALNDLIETQIKLNSDHSFWNDSIKQYLEIPDVYLTTGIVNSILMFAGRIETLVDGAIYRLYRTESEYNNGYVTIDGRFIMVGNLIAKNSVLANIAATDGVHVSQVNIWDKNGNVSWAAKWTPDEVKAIERFQGYRSFQKEYMNNPITEGAVFRQDWIKWGKLPDLKKFEELVLYIDPSFKGTTKNDYKAAKLWGKVGSQLWHIKAFVRQCSVAEMVRWLYDLYEWSLEKGIAIKWYMEANFMQDTILDEFRREGDLRGYQLPISGDKRKKPDISAKEAIFSGFAVGRAACGSTTTTLLLAYSGSFITLLMVFMAQGTPVMLMLNYKYVAAEIIHTIVGSFGLVTVAPLTAITSGILFTNKRV